MGVSLGNLIVILLIILVVFGAGKLPNVVGDLAKAIKNFRNNLHDKDEESDVEKKRSRRGKNDRRK